MYKQIVLIALILATASAFDFKLFTNEMVNSVNSNS